MRRRVWAFIRQADIMFSFQMGLPSMVRLRSFEQGLPRNIHDDYSFNEDCVELPPALPDLEPTKIGYLLAKTKLAFGYARAVKEITRSESIRWERILEIDRELRRIYNSIPEDFKLGPFTNTDSLVLVSYRFTLASIHHKSLCVIHSRFSELGRTDPRFSYSRKVSLTSAMSILRFQAIQNKELPVDGRLRTMTGYQTSLTIHDYLIAATLISTDLYADIDTGNNVEQVESGGLTRAEMVRALATSAKIFRQTSEMSVEAFKAADVLEMLVKRFKSKTPRQAKQQMTTQRKSSNEQQTKSGKSSGIAYVDVLQQDCSFSHGMVSEIDSLVTDNHMDSGEVLSGETLHVAPGGDLPRSDPGMSGNVTDLALDTLANCPVQGGNPTERYVPDDQSYSRLEDQQDLGATISSEMWMVSIMIITAGQTSADLFRFPAKNL